MKKTLSKIMMLLMAVALLCGVVMNVTEAQAAKKFGTDMDSAVRINLNKECSGTLIYGNTNHWYKFTTKSNDDFYYNFLINQNKNGSIYCKVYDENGEVVETFTRGQGQIRFKAGTTYYISVYSNSGFYSENDKQAYAFEIDTLKDPETDYLSEVSIELKNGKKQKGSIATLGDEDWFWFTANTDKATLTVLTKDYWSIKYAAYDENGTKLCVDSTTAFSGTLSFDTVKGKKYYICIFTNSNGFDNFEFGEEKDDTYNIVINNGKADKVDTPVCMFAGTKVIAGEAVPGAKVKCTYKGKTYSATANSFGLYVIKLNTALKKNAGVQIWQTVGGSTSKKNTFKISK